MEYTGLPPDWDVPDWKKWDKIHNWRNHVPNEVQAIWQTFTPEQKVILARAFEKMAMDEEWD